MSEITHIHATISLAHRDAQQAHLTHFRPQRVGHLVVRIDLSRKRRNAVLSEAMGCLAQRLHILAKRKIHRCCEHR